MGFFGARLFDHQESILESVGGGGGLPLISLFVIIILGFYLYKPYFSVRKIPGPPVLPLLGHLPLLAKHGPDVFSVLAKTYGPVFRFHMGRQPLVIIADAELCREVGIKKFKFITNRSIPSPIAASPLHQKGLFFTKDLRWSTMRNAVLSVYQPSHLAKLIPTMQSFIESASEEILDSHEEEEEEDMNIINFSELSLKLATDIIGQAAFGVDFGLSKSKTLHQSSSLSSSIQEDFVDQQIYTTSQLKMDLTGSISIILGLLVPILQEPCRQILKRIPGTIERKLEKTNRKLTRRLGEIVAKRKAMIDQEKGRFDDFKDFMSLILSARKDQEVKDVFFSPDYISAVTYEHLLTGSATTSFTLSSVIYLVSEHPEVEMKVIREIDDFGPHNLIPTALDLQLKFPYIDQASDQGGNETLHIGTINFKGNIIPSGDWRGTWVWTAVGVLAKDRKNFPEPEKFKPERFDPNCEEEKQRHPYANIPFGIGPRSCLGEKFSLQEIKLTLIHLYRQYIFRHSPTMEKPPQLDYGIVRSFKHGIKVRAIRRSNS